MVFVFEGIGRRICVLIRDLDGKQSCEPRLFEGPYSKTHGCEQSAPDLAILWQAVSALIFADHSPPAVVAHAIDRTIIIVSHEAHGAEFVQPTGRCMQHCLGKQIDCTDHRPPRQPPPRKLPPRKPPPRKPLPRKPPPRKPPLVKP